MTDTVSPPTPVRHRPPRAMRRFGYLIAAAMSAVVLLLLNVTPGWDVLPFLTNETPEALPAVNVAVAAGLVANLVYIAVDPRWLRALGDTVAASAGLVAILRLWEVFPFGFSGMDASLVVRVVLGLGIVGTAVAIVVGLVTLVRELVIMGLGGSTRPTAHS